MGQRAGRGHRHTRGDTDHKGGEKQARGAAGSPRHLRRRIQLVEKFVEMEVVVRCRRDHPPPPWGAAIGRPAVVATRPIVTGVDEAELRQAHPWMILKISEYQVVVFHF